MRYRNAGRLNYSARYLVQGGTSPVISTAVNEDQGSEFRRD